MLVHAMWDEVSAPDRKCHYVREYDELHNTACGKYKIWSPSVIVVGHMRVNCPECLIELIRDLLERSDEFDPIDLEFGR